MKRRRTSGRHAERYDGTPHPWEFARVWHLEPSWADPDTVYAGVQDAGLFRSTDGGATWRELPGLRAHDSAADWQPGAGGLCLHTILIDPTDAKKLTVAISAAGAFRSDDAGDTWRPINRGLVSQGMPDPTAEVGHCVHRVAMHTSRPNVLFMQKHWDVMRSDDAGASWQEVSGNLPSDFGFPIDVHSHAVAGQATQRSVLDAVEARYPMLRGTIRDHLTQQRRPLVRFFACQEDLSHELPDTPLPEDVVTGKEPFLIVGALAGG